jgi:alkylhydroperoxidase/carboxymuconolactone decarboxylase family protein YurZ
MTSTPKPPKAFQQFVARYPKLGEAWDNITEAGEDGPLDERTRRLIKLGVAIGAMRSGAVHSSVRKAVGMGISREELEQVVALAAGTMGMPSTVAAFSWVQDLFDDSAPTS